MWRRPLRGFEIEPKCRRITYYKDFNKIVQSSHQLMIALTTAVSKTCGSEIRVTNDNDIEDRLSQQNRVFNNPHRA